MSVNLFDGISGNSDGTADGPSREINESSGPVSIFVFGTFGTASVTIQRFSHATQAFVDTAAVWSAPDVFQDLFIKSGDRYRLYISNSSDITDLIAEES